MDFTWIAKMLSGTVTRGVLWAIAGVAAYLTIKGIVVPDVNADKVQEVVQGILLFILPIVASWWSHRKDKTLLVTPPPPTTPL